MRSFKQFLLEGGAAMEKHGVGRATKADIDSVLSQLATTLSMSKEQLTKQLLGSTTLTLKGKQEDSGDVDVGFLKDKREEIVAAVEQHTGVEGRKLGKSIVSFPFKTEGDKKVQVDLVFVPDMRWARFSHFASQNSKYKSGVRNELIHSTLKFSKVPGEDHIHFDDEGNLIARASRSYNLEDGVKRVFKVSPKRKDGNGRVKTPISTTPEEVRKAFDEEGVKATFSDKEDVVLDPNKLGELLFGKGVGGDDMLSTEQLIKLIKTKRKDDAEAILKDAVEGIKRRSFEVPEELKEYDTAA
jgi:hypothetical protein